MTFWSGPAYKKRARALMLSLSVVCLKLVGRLISCEERGASLIALPRPPTEHEVGSVDFRARTDGVYAESVLRSTRRLIYAPLSPARVT